MYHLYSIDKSVCKLISVYTYNLRLIVSYNQIICTSHVNTLNCVILLGKGHAV